MIERVLLDTSALYAHMNTKDPDHNRVKGYLLAFHGNLFITNFIFDEIITLALTRMGHRKAVFTGETLMNQKGLAIVRVSPADEKIAWDLFVNRPDKTYSFTDCTSFAIMRRLGISRALTVDPHFQQEGFELVV
ncbi:MAG: type II toxin-antitoxin system VapC family toxin [Deltaproteobacteria bacterium]|nr:type II toxin-antitoxin system VapC family toxin [Deltaproteobacteria bacterium]